MKIFGADNGLEWLEWNELTRVCWVKEFEDRGVRNYKLPRKVIHKNKSLCPDNSFVYFFPCYASPFRLCFCVEHNAFDRLEVALPKSFRETKKSTASVYSD